MSTATVFQIHLVLGYVPWLLFFAAYVWPRLEAMDRVAAQRAVATLHSFRFFGLVFVVPGVVGANLPVGFATFAAYGDFATGVLAMLALLAIRPRPLFWSLVFAYNLVEAADIIVDYLPRQSVRPAGAGGTVRRRLLGPDHLRAGADDHTRHSILFNAATSAEGGADNRRWPSQILKHG